MGRPLGSKNKNSLTKRNVVDAPKPLPARGKEAPEPDTYLCKGPETEIDKSEPLLGMCKECGRFQANSEVDHLCVNCHKEAEGFVFVEDEKRFVKRTKGRK
jgi:hypothetical protein